MPKKYLEDGEYYRCEGLFSSRIVAEKSLLYYIVETQIVGSGGAMHFCYAPATKFNLNKLVKNLESSFMSFAISLKDNYIDSSLEIEKIDKKNERC